MKRSNILNSPLQTIEFRPQNKSFRWEGIEKNKRINMANSAPNFYSSHKRVFLETRYLSVIHELQEEN